MKPSDLTSSPAAAEETSRQISRSTVIPGAAPHNCGGRCLMKAHVENGVIKKFDTDERPDKDVFNGNDPQLRACLKCRAYLGRLYHPARLQYPLKQTKQRGDITGFVRINWDQAIDLVADELKRVKNRYGNESIYCHYGTGYPGILHGRQPLLSLLNHFGGHLSPWGSYSSHQHEHMMPFVVGDTQLSATPDSLIHSKLIILWGSNFAETILGTNTPWYVMQAKEAGCEMVYIGPYQNDTCAAYADDWIPIKPGTDAAMMLSMLYVMIDEDLLNIDTIKRFTHGFFDAPNRDVPPGLSLSAYVMGDDDKLVNAGLNIATCQYPGDGDVFKYPYKAINRAPKTPEWAEEITGVSAEVIRKLARKYADSKNPAYLHCSLGLQRQSEGCQTMFLMFALAAVSGQWGRMGSGTGIHFDRTRGHRSSGSFPAPPNKVKKKIPTMLWTDAARNPGRSEWDDGQVNDLKYGIKFIINFAGNCLINQHMDINKTKTLLQDKSKIEFICAIDNFLTSSARFADVLLPGATNWEQNDLFLPTNSNDSVIFSNKAVDPPGGAKTSYEIFSLLAEKLELKDIFTQGKAEEDWLRLIWRNMNEPISFETLKKRGVYKPYLGKDPYVGGRKIREHGYVDPLKKDLRFNTREVGDIKSTGKIELYSRALVHEYETRGAGHDNRDEDGDPMVYPIPMFFPESAIDKKTADDNFPFMVLTPHSRYSVHSTHGNNPYLRELNKVDANGYPAYDSGTFAAEPLQPRFDSKGLHEVWINAGDAKKWEIHHHDRVEVYNGFGAIAVSAKVTQRVMPGVLVIYQGAWHDADQDNVDDGGCANVLTTETATRIDHGNAQMIAHANIRRI